MEQLDGIAGPAGPPGLTVTYDGAAKQLIADGSIFVDPATDVDHDGLSQSFEDQAIDLATPVLELDDDELWLDMPASHPTVNFAQATVWPSAADPQWVVIGYLNTWAYDPGGGDEFFQTDLPLVGVRENHRGDSERMWEAWRVIDDQRVQLVWVATSAHHGVTDHSAVWKVGERQCNVGNVAAVDTSGTPAADWNFEQSLCSDLEFDGAGRLVLYPSQDKHAIYPSAAVCEAVVLAAHASSGLPIWGEDCGWDPFLGFDLTDYGTAYLGDGRWQFESFNVGEPGYPLIDDLDTPTALTELSTDRANLVSGGYPNEAVWFGHSAGSSFCGGFEQGEVVDMTWPRGDIAMPAACSTRLGTKFTAWQSIFVEALQARYRVVLQTGTVADAGTNAKAVIALADADGATLATRQYGGSLEAGDSDIVYLASSGAGAGAVATVRIRRTGTPGQPSDWYLASVQLTDLVTGATSTATVGQWVTTGAGLTLTVG